MPDSTPDNPLTLEAFIERHCRSQATILKSGKTVRVVMHFNGPRCYSTREEIFMELPCGFVERQEWRSGKRRSVWVSPEHMAFVFQREDNVQVEVCSTTGLFWRRLRSRESNGGECR